MADFLGDKTCPQTIYQCRSLKGGEGSVYFFEALPKAFIHIRRQIFGTHDPRDPRTKDW